MKKFLQTLALEAKSQQGTAAGRVQGIPEQHTSVNRKLAPMTQLTDAAAHSSEGRVCVWVLSGVTS